MGRLSREFFGIAYMIEYIRQVAIDKVTCLDSTNMHLVYSLWNVPGLLPLLHTPGIVVQKIKKGADLMTPGLAGPPFPDRAKKDAIVAVADLDNPSVPVAVGTCQIDISALTSTAGVKGVAVETTHWAGDELWDWSTSGKSGIAAPESLHGWLEDDGEEVAQGTEGLSLEEPTDEDATGYVDILLFLSRSRKGPLSMDYHDVVSLTTHSC